MSQSILTKPEVLIVRKEGPTKDRKYWSFEGNFLRWYKSDEDEEPQLKQSQKKNGNYGRYYWCTRVPKGFQFLCWEDGKENVSLEQQVFYLQKTLDEIVSKIGK